MSDIETALLPIEAPVLPKGRKELRIVTPGQLRMVASSLKDENVWLVACMNRDEADMPCYPLATQVRVVDFHQLDDDSLAIVVEGVQKVRIDEVWADRDGVWRGRVLPQPNWPSRPLGDNYAMLGQALQRLYEAQPALAGLYPNPQLNDACWVSQRWLEVLPLIEKDKQMLMGQPDCRKTMQYVMSLIRSHQAAQER